MTRGGARVGAGRPRGQGQFGEPTKPVRIPESLVEKVTAYISHQGYQLPFYACAVSAGFPSPADDFLERSLDLNEHLIKNPSATFFVRVVGDSMLGAGIHPDDILVVDRSLTPVHGKIIIAAVDGQLTVKRLHKKNKKVCLLPENDEYSAIELSPDNDVVIWGVVTTVLHSV